MNQTTETAPATGADASGARKGGLNAMLLPELKQLAGGLGIKATGMRKGALIEAIKTAQGGGQSSKRDNDSSNAKQGANETAAAPERSSDETKRSEGAEAVTALAPAGWRVLRQGVGGHGAAVLM